MRPPVLTVPANLLLETLALVEDVADCTGLGCLCLPEREIDGRMFPALRCLQCRAGGLEERWAEAAS
jgi:hypothetical protein